MLCLFRFLLLVVSTYAQVTQQVWPSTAFAPESASLTSSPLIVNATDFCGSTVVCSARWRGMITLPYDDLITFTLSTDASVRLWIDDHLIVDSDDTGTRAIKSGLNVSFLQGISQKIRLDYRQSDMTSGGKSYVNLAWKGNTTAGGSVPASVFSDTLPPGELQRIAMADRLLTPPVQWQTYDNPTMGTHVRMPQSVALKATLGYNTDSSSLGNIFVFRRASPAVTLVGQHSYNGSDFTELTVSDWKGVNCAVTFMTTTSNAGQDLFFVATANGTQCALLSLLITPQMLWGRAGIITMPSVGVAHITSPGFNDTIVYTTVPPKQWGTDATIWSLALDNGPVGFSTGAPMNVNDMVTAINAARVRQADIVNAWGPDLAPLYEPMASVIAWNTMFTPYEGVVTPVSRGWDFGAGYVIFDCEFKSKSKSVSQ
jgi:PA14 domain